MGIGGIDMGHAALRIVTLAALSRDSFEQLSVDMGLFTAFRAGSNFDPIRPIRHPNATPCFKWSSTHAAGVPQAPWRASVGKSRH